MSTNIRTELCHFCDEKFKLENDMSVENHNWLHKEEIEGIKISKNMKDAVKTICHLCQTPQACSRMREHTKRAHNVHITEYKLKYNIANDRGYELVEKVFHKCGICSHVFPLDSDLIAGHIRKHNITHANYNAKYMIIKKNGTDKSSKKQKSKENKPLITTKESEPNNTEDSTKKRFPSGLQVSVGKATENNDGTDKNIGQVEIETKEQETSSNIGHSTEDNQPAEKASPNETPIKAPDTAIKPLSKVLSPKKEDVKPELSYAEQISMFLRGKQMEMKDKLPADDGDEKKVEMKTPSEGQPKSVKIETIRKEPIPNKPNVDSLIGILEKRNSYLNTKQLATKPTIPPSLTPASKPAPAVNPLRHSWHNPPLQKSPPSVPTQATTPHLSPPVIKIPKSVETDLISSQISPKQSTHSSNTENTMAVDTMKTSNFSPSSPKHISSGAIQILSPDAINRRYEDRKTTPVPIKAYLPSEKKVQVRAPLTIMGQSAIKKVKLMNGKVLHLFIKSSKASDQPAKVDEQKCIVKPEAITERVGSLKNKPEKYLENIPEDPLLVNVDTPAFQVPDKIDINQLIGGSNITKINLETHDTSESTTIDVELEKMSTDIGHNIKEKVNALINETNEKDIENDECRGENSTSKSELESNVLERDEVGMETGELGQDHESTATTPNTTIEIEMDVENDKTNENVTGNHEVETDQTRMETELKGKDHDDVINTQYEEYTARNVDDSSSVPISDPSDEKETEVVPDGELDDSGFSDVDVSGISSVSDLLDSSFIEKNDMEKNTEELINRLATKTKLILELQHPNSPEKDNIVKDREKGDEIDKSREFSEMMKRISDNMAQFNGNKNILSTQALISRLNEKDCEDVDSLETDGNDVSEDELDLVVEGIWSENTL